MFLGNNRLKYTEKSKNEIVMYFENNKETFEKIKDYFVKQDYVYGTGYDDGKVSFTNGYDYEETTPVWDDQISKTIVQYFKDVPSSDPGYIGYQSQDVYFEFYYPSSREFVWIYYSEKQKPSYAHILQHDKIVGNWYLGYSHML